MCIKQGRKGSQVWDHFVKESIVLKAHLTLHCTEIPQNVKLEFMTILTTVNMVPKDSNKRPITNFYDSTNEIEKAFVMVINHPKEHLFQTILDKESAAVLKKINDELKHKDNLTLAKGIQDKAFRKMCLTAMKILLNYELALKLFAITPHQATCERVFSILNWMIGKRRTGKTSINGSNDSYFITNVKSELKFSISNLDITKNLNELLITKEVDLDIPEFDENNENINSDIEVEEQYTNNSTVHEESEIDFESLLDENTFFKFN
ncbi:8027_t:CDS:2 [Diversispora eburnea]|uniref:8027_t:CDS:1 n=1 Tax=Diversispora eburnea TaxID=1213867 RepID=A0A9N8WMV8_9GLOM|nr:8027_t:CDS:2 [Diversispora eburnea]